MTKPRDPRPVVQCPLWALLIRASFAIIVAAMIAAAH